MGSDGKGAKINVDGQLGVCRRAIRPEKGGRGGGNGQIGGSLFIT